MRRACFAWSVLGALGCNPLFGVDDLAFATTGTGGATTNSSSQSGVAGNDSEGGAAGTQAGGGDPGGAGAGGVEPCGGIGARCCDGRCLDEPLRCIEGTCQPCGEEAQPCCGASSCDANMICAETLETAGLAPGCGRCGAAGQVCCSGASCNVGLDCTSLPSGLSWCVTDSDAAVSLPGGKCTPASDEVCANGATCVADGAQPYCLACGLFNYFCCPGGSPAGDCPAGTTCQVYNAFTHICKP